MPFRISNPEKVARIATIITLSFMVCWGAASAFTEIRPFWVDEWRVIYNLKFKSPAELWGPLDFLQQFPRVYLSLVKSFTNSLNYSYVSLRVPSFIIGTLTIVFCYRLMNRLFKPAHFNKFLFVMTLISCSTFTEYYVQIKQYTMDMFLSLVAIWQLLELVSFNENGRFRSGKFILLCLSFLVLPFFSYTYPIVITPVFAIILIQNVQLLQKRGKEKQLKRTLLLQWVPLFICTFSTTLFYVVDVSQLMHDKGMHDFWGHIMLDKGFSFGDFLYSFYNLFAEVGSGLIFWLLFGILGMAAFLYGIYKSAVNFRLPAAKTDVALLYSVLLLLLAIFLFIAGKLPLGEPRLNAFTIPAISILIIHLLDQMKQNKAGVKLSNVLAAILLAGLIGNIYTTFVAAVTGPEYAKKMAIYHATENAIREAQDKKMPILITPDVAYPYEKTRNLPFNNTVPGDWVLKTFPSYMVHEKIAVYAISDMKNARELIRRVPIPAKSVIAGNGQQYTIISRGSRQ